MEKYDIYWFDFIYREDILSDSPRSKRRPVVILDTDIILPIVPVTSHKKRANDNKDYEIINWKAAGLTEPSTIRFGLKRNIARSKINNDYIGHLSEEDIRMLKAKHLVEQLTEAKYDADSDFYSIELEGSGNIDVKAIMKALGLEGNKSASVMNTDGHINIYWNEKPEDASFNYSIGDRKGTHHLSEYRDPREDLELLQRVPGVEWVYIDYPGEDVVEWEIEGESLTEDRKSDIEATLLDDEPSFADYMRDMYGMDIFDDPIAENPDVEDYYLDEYENYLDHLYDLDDDSYDADHAAEWMERYPHGYYNDENDYGVDAEEDDTDPEQFLDAYELRRDMSDEEAKAQIKKVFDDDLANGMIGQEDYDRGTKEVYDYWQKLHTTNEALTEAVKPFVDDKVINSIRRYEMYHLPDSYIYADVDSAMRVDQVGTSSGEQPHDIIKATVCYVTPDNEEEYAEHKYKVFDDGRVEAISEESLDEAVGKKYRVTGTLRNIWYDDNGNEVDREEWEETHTYTIDPNTLQAPVTPEALAKVKFEDKVTKYWDKRVRHDDGSEFSVDVTSVEELNESLDDDGEKKEEKPKRKSKFTQDQLWDSISRMTDRKKNYDESLTEAWNKKKVPHLDIPYTQLVNDLYDAGIDPVMAKDPVREIRRYLVDRTGMSMANAEKIASKVADNIYDIENDMDESLNEATKPLTNYSSYKLAKLLTDKYYDLTMGKIDKQPFNDWFNKTFGAENRKEAASIISNFTTDNEKRVNKDDLFYVRKYVDRVASLLTESLTESKDKKYRAELYYYDNNNPDDTVYFTGLKDAYNFCNRETGDDDITGITGIIIYNNSTDKKINTWQNGSRGWEKKVNESLNEAQFSSENSNDDIRLVKSSYDHFMNDLGEIPSPDDILYDILDNYNQDIFQEGGPMIEGKEIEAIKYILRSQGLEYRGDLDEAKNDTLNADIWDDNKELRPEVKEKLELIVEKFKSALAEDKVDLDIKDIIIVGSNANYNYGDNSDIDLHIVADLSSFKGREKELAATVYNCFRRIFNDKFDPKIRGREVELYVEPADDVDNNEVPDTLEPEEGEVNED